MDHDEPVACEPEDELTDDLIGDELPDEDAATDALLKGTLDLAAALAEDK
jgi:hypothetical protein